MCHKNDQSEFVLGLVAPVGVDLDSIENNISDHIKQFSYKENIIRLSTIIKENPSIETEINENNRYNRISSLMTAGNEIREKASKGEILSVLAILKINELRKENEPIQKTIHVIRSLKHPEEVMALRKVYSHGFFLLGISSSENNRRNFLTTHKGMKKEQADELIKRDEDETKKFGQRTRDVFHLADGFVDIDAKDSFDQIGRIFNLIFGHPYITPTKDEYAMYLAYASSLRSADLSRQVGAVIMSEQGEIISTGANDVPKSGGGLYWSGDQEDQRDYIRGYDSNEKRRNEMVLKIIKKLNLSEEQESEYEIIKKGRMLLKETGILDITEYGRAVHAEMEAILAEARIGVSPRRSTLYCTTYPCHNCAKHIVASGIKRVVFVEPYPKSKALDLHDDTISVTPKTTEESTNKVLFQPFVGIGYRRFFDLFSTKLSTGFKIEREINGEVKEWDRPSASVRVPLVPLSYTERERILIKETKQSDFYKSILEKNKGL